MSTNSFTQDGIDHKLVNGRDGDPAIYSFFHKTGEALLFDLGSLDALAHKDLSKVRHVCVSHTHIDHFIGFDRLLRINIPHARLLTLCGPNGICDNIIGKLKGYTWNLLEEDQLVFEIHEISRRGEVASFRLSNSNGFRKDPIDNPKPKLAHSVRPLPESPASFVANLADGSRIEAVALEHGNIDSIGYLIQAPMHFKVVDSALERFGLEPGPWIGQAQAMVAKAKTSETINIDGRDWNIGELASEVFTTSTPRRVGYLSDLRFSRDNLERVRELMLDVELLFCEASFAKKDRQKASLKSHLTSFQAALIAAYLRTKSLHAFHHSRIYRSTDIDICLEADAAFGDSRKLGGEKLAQALEAELALIPDDLINS